MREEFLKMRNKPFVLRCLESHNELIWAELKIDDFPHSGIAFISQDQTFKAHETHLCELQHVIYQVQRSCAVGRWTGGSATSIGKKGR